MWKQKIGFPHYSPEKEYKFRYLFSYMILSIQPTNLQMW